MLPTKQERDTILKEAKPLLNEDKEFLMACIRNAQQKLAEPNVKYPNGRMSHDVQTEVLNNSETALYDLMISKGHFCAEGTFAGLKDFNQ